MCGCANCRRRWPEDGALRGRTARARRVRPGDDGSPTICNGDDVPAWLLDTDYNGLVFHGNQVFFPRTGAWEHLKKALKATHDESVWDHLAGTTSAPFDGGRAPPGRGQGHRRPRQRADRGQAVGRGGVTIAAVLARGGITPTLPLPHQGGGCERLSPSRGEGVNGRRALATLPLDGGGLGGGDDGR